MTKSMKIAICRQNDTTSNTVPIINITAVSPVPDMASSFPKYWAPEEAKSARQQSLLVPITSVWISRTANLGGSIQYDGNSLSISKIGGAARSSGTPMSSAEEDSSKESRTSCISVAKVLPFGTGLANPARPLGY